MNKNHKNNFIAEGIPIHTADEVYNLPDSYRPSFYAFQFIPLVIIRINTSDVILMKQSTGRWSGYSIENIRYIYPASQNGLPRFLSHTDTIAACLASETKSSSDKTPVWQNKIDGFFTEIFPESGFSMRTLYDDIHRNIGHNTGKSDLCALSPFSNPASFLYLSPEHSFSGYVLYSAFFLKLNFKTDDYTFLEYKNFEFVPVEFCFPNIHLHPRYQIHTAVKMFFSRYGTRYNENAISLINEIPRISWKMKEEKIEVLTFIADFSYYYDAEQEPAQLINAFHTPNPGSTEEKLISNFTQIQKTCSNNSEFVLDFNAALDNYITMELFKSGMFYRTSASGCFYGLIETELLQKNGTLSLNSFLTLAHLIRYLKKVRLFIDLKNISTVGPLYDEPRRWFNLRRDIVPFDFSAELKRSNYLFSTAEIPLTIHEAETGYTKSGMIITERAAEFLKIENTVFLKTGKMASKIEPNKIYQFSKDDSLVCFMPVSGAHAVKNRNVYLWRNK